MKYYISTITISMDNKKQLINLFDIFIDYYGEIKVFLRQKSLYISIHFIQKIVVCV